MLDEQTLNTYYAAMDLGTAREKLRSQVQTHPQPSLFSSEEVSYPEVVLRVAENEIECSQRKSYINPWECRLRGTLTASENNGVRIELRRIRTSFLERWLKLEAIGFAWIVAGIAAVIYEARTGGPNAVRAALMVGTLIAATAVYVVIMRRTERAYRERTKNEQDFLLNYLSNLLTLQQDPYSGTVPQLRTVSSVVEDVLPATEEPGGR